MKKISILILLSTFLLSGCAISDLPSISGNTDNSEITGDNSTTSKEDSNSETQETTGIITTEDGKTTENTTTENTTIDKDDLDDYSQSVPSKYITTKTEVTNYYINIKDSQKGNDLKNALASLISNHTKRNYDYLEEDMRIADRNWKVSPAENDKNPFMNLLYYTKNDDIDKRQTWNKYASTKNPNGPQMWNKEHIWAKSNGFPSKGKLAYSDLHHLRASDMKNNGTRSSLPFGEVVSNAANVLDFSGTVSGIKGQNNGANVYEPKDEFKGDVARALFYMATRYGASDGLKLALTDGKDSSGGKWGFVSTLIKWNKQDLPDAFEIRRNDIIYKEFQHNRNPFIDHPEYADRIYNNI